MRPSPMLLNAAKRSGKQSWYKTVPVETYPLFAVMGFVLGYATFQLGKKLTSGELRTQRQGKQVKSEESH